MKKRLGLYLHIPFCVKKCKYCAFLSQPVTSSAKEAYVNAVMGEIRGKWRELGSQSRLRHEVKTMYVGGGTPSLLEAWEVERLVRACKEAFSVKDGDLLEFTIEANPGTLDGEKLKAYRKLGVDRISFGLQSVNDEELRALGRVHSYRDFVRSYRLAREAGFSNVSVDLMSGLPNQSLGGFLKGLQTVCALQPEHMSVYGLMVEPGTEFFELYGEDSPLGEDGEREMMEACREVLEGEGYRRYETSNYARQGYESLHNLSYWEGVDYLGLGLGASSLMDGVRYQNESDLERYGERVGKGQSIFSQERVLSRDEQMEEFMFLGLRMAKGVSEADFFLAFGRTMDEAYGDVLNKWEKSGHVERRDARVRLTDEGFYVGNRILADFLLS